MCSPTRAALLTGRYPFRYGLQTSVVKPWSSYGLPVDERTLPQALREVGYETAIVGKWHLGHARPEFLPLQRGFDHQYGHYNGALDYFTHQRDGGHDWHRDDQPNYDKGYSTTLLAGEAVRLIESRDAAKPLFLYVPFTAVHAPHQVPEKYAEPYDSPRPRRKAYMGMVAAMDEAVGQIVAALRAQKIDGNTIIFFSSDNGGPNPGTISRNGDLRDGKGSTYEGGVRTCAFATWPGAIPAGSTRSPIHMVDLYPTLLAIAGGNAEQPKPIDGRNILPLLKGEIASAREEVLIHVGPQACAIRSGDWKLVLNGQRRLEEDAEDLNAPATQPTEPELFDLATDISEKRNVAADHPEIVARLRARYDELLKQAAPAESEARDSKFRSPKIWGHADQE
jgi:arylsulfatase A-like enzyme